MRSGPVDSRRRTISGLAVLFLAIGIVTTSPMLSVAHAPAMTVTIVNNFSRDIRHVYLSPSTQDNWGPDVLNESVISPGGTYNLNNVSCGDSDIKVIAEDQDGCFFYQVVDCGEDASWTITSDAGRDCGS
jgi:hypothetical protein